MKRRFSKEIVMLFAVLLLVAMPWGMGRVFGGAPAGEGEVPVAVRNEAEPGGGSEWRPFWMDAGLGAGGLHSRGGTSTAFLLGAALGWRFHENGLLLLGYRAKFHPWESYHSSFHTVGPRLGWIFWRGMYVGVEGGLAWSYLEKGRYQQARLGGGWGVEWGYVHFFAQNIGLKAGLGVHQRWLGQLYTDFGILLGPVAAF